MGTGQGLYGLRDLHGKGHVITGDRIMTAGAGIDAVMDHVNVMVVTGIGVRKVRSISHYGKESC